jgi:molybdopterin-containing oxidoreductase family iron-sulfur binding subunit
MKGEGITPALAEALGRIRGKSGRAYWRGLDELLDHDAFRARVADEFPWLGRLAEGLNRRDLIKCLGGALALAGLDGCERRPDERALPYVETPEGAVPGVPRYYATALEMDGVAQPAIGKTVDGRPIKIEGNPDHPASGGATDAFSQAALLGLYDPARSGAPRKGDALTTWDAVDVMLIGEMRQLDARRGAGLRLVTGAGGGPTLQRQMTAILHRWPEARWHVDAGDEAWAAASRGAYGRLLDRRLHLDRAEAIVALDDDLLGPGPLQTWHARGWSARRQAWQQGRGDAALFVAEPSPTLTGVIATERLIAAHRRMPALLAAIAARLGIETGAAVTLAPKEAAWADAAAASLARHRGRALLTLGAHHPPELQHLALAIDARLNGAAVAELAERPDPRPEGLAALAHDLDAGAVDTLIVIDANPAYTAPGDLRFGAAMDHARLRLHAGLHRDETAACCHWHLPLAHGLESWSDGIAADGTPVLIQPLVRPFLDVRARHALLARLAGMPATDHDAVRATWAERWGDGFEARWQQALVSGRIDDAAPPAVAATPAVPPPLRPAPRPACLDIVLRPDPSIWDGRFAANPWLQELPEPLTKMTWGNAVLVAPALAAQLGVGNGRRVRLSAGGRRVEGPLWILPGQEAGTVLVHLGHGRTGAGPVGDGVGFDAAPLRTAVAPWHIAGATIEPLDGEEPVATTQLHFAMSGEEDFVRFVDGPADALPPPTPHRTFYPPQPRSDPAWGMSIDLDLCIGCNACVASCVAENNIATVGKELVAQQREMHWLRVDRYFEGPPDDPRHVFQPVPCMHCENAPCEMGCPVNATVHSPDGLNLQVYNRCIGTRTCSAYCPYKVRRFNWFDYTGDDPPELRAARNPDVTVRGRGVMEKCTYCIQRIAEARIEAEREGRPIREGEVKTACQQACPTDAIVFGNVADRRSAVSRRKASGRDYSLLEEAQTRPRTTYLARIAKGEGKA